MALFGVLTLHLIPIDTFPEISLISSATAPVPLPVAPHELVFPVAMLHLTPNGRAIPKSGPLRNSFRVSLY